MRNVLFILAALLLSCVMACAEGSADCRLPASSSRPSARVARHIVIDTPEPPARTAPYPTVTTPCWSSDGRLVATHQGVWRIDAVGKATRILAIEDGVQAVGFSPNGKEFACLKFEYGRQAESESGQYRAHRLPDLHMISLDTEKDRVVAGDVILASWSPDGKRFAFYRPANADSTGALPVDAGLFVVDSDGRSEKKVTDLTLRQTHFLPPEPPVWSHQGSRMAFVKGTDEIWLANADGTNPHRLKSFENEWPRSTELGAPAWSSDNQYLQLVVSEVLSVEVVLGPEHAASINTTTGDMKLLSDTLDGRIDQRINGADWSPDLSRTAFLVDTSAWEKVKTMQQQPVTNGKEIAGYTGIWIANRDGSGITQAVGLYEPGHSAPRDRQFLWSSTYARPAWSPDGRKIAATVPSTPNKLHVLVLE